MKRLIALLLLAGALVVTAIGCGDSSSVKKTGTSGGTSSTETTKPKPP